MGEDSSPTDFLSGRPEASDLEPSPRPSTQHSGTPAIAPPKPAYPGSTAPETSNPAIPVAAPPSQDELRDADGRILLAPLPDFNQDPKPWRRRQRIAHFVPFVPKFLLDYYFRIVTAPTCCRFAAEDAHHPYVVIGIFYKGNTIPHEHFVTLQHHRQGFVFWRLKWEIFKLRGLWSLLSLKGVQSFRVYRCNWENGGSHEGVELARAEKHKLLLFLFAYRSWRLEHLAGGLWVDWLMKSLNNGSTDPTGGPPDRSLSLEVVLGWSAPRITVVILIPIILSLGLGLGLQGIDPSSDDIQAAWTVASYVVTAAALMAALLGFATNAAT